MLCTGDQFDHDGRDDTVCVECDTCGDGEYEWQTCTPLQNRKCAPCGSNPTGELAQLIDRTNPMSTQCSDVDPDCLDTVDVLVLYTQAYLQLLGGSVDSVIASANQAVNTSNDALKNALVPPNYRFRLVAVEEFPYEERDDLKGDLVWLRNNPHYQATRRAHGADVGIALLGTEGFGGLAYSNHSTGAAFIERGLLVVDGVYFVPSFSDCQRAMLTIGHELGHVLGAGHRASQYTGSQGIGYGYHNQEPLYRRNDAYGLEVSQHGQKFYSLMSYANYKNENNQNRGCTDCIQLNAFSSPDLWWFFDQMEPNHGFCLVLDDTDPTAISLQCNIAEPWLVENGAYIVNPESEVTLPSDELLTRAVPVGVDQPAYIDPADGVTEVTAPFSARNRDRVMDYWEFRSGTHAPLAPVENCNAVCADLNRANCSVVSPECGSCLPGYRLKGGICLDRIESNTDPLHDGRFERGPISVDPADGSFEINMPMETGSVLEAIELYLMTVNANGDIDYDWAGFSPNVWSLDAAPEHAFELVVYRSDGSSVVVGTESSEGAIMQDISAQKNHSLTYEFEVSPPITEVDRVVLRLQSNSGYAFNVSEVMVFGRVP